MKSALGLCAVLTSAFVPLAVVGGLGPDRGLEGHREASNDILEPFPGIEISTTLPAPAPATVSEQPTRGEQVQVGTTAPPPPPPPPVWTGPLPAYYGGDTNCDRDQATIIARAMWAEGASDDTVEWMLWVISRESGCDSSAHNGNRNTGDDSWGLCQLNVLAGFFRPGEILAAYDPYSFGADFAHSAAACARLWAECGRGPWTKGDYGCRTPRELL